MKLSIIIPVYKGENTIGPFFNKIQDTLEGEYDYEVIFISDNAIDDSWSKIKYLQRSNPQKVKGFKLKYNYGQHNALLFGIKAASGEYLITMDEDMQHDPKYIPPMLTFLLKNNLDVVYGNFLRVKKNGVRKVGSKFGRRIAGLLIPNLYRGYSPFRIINSDIVNVLGNKKNIAFIDGQLGSATNKFGEYPIEHFENKRPSSYSIFKLVRLAASVIIWYSGIAQTILIIFILLLIGFSLNLIINLSGNDPGLTELAALIIMFLLFGLISWYVVLTKTRKTIKVIETIGID